MSRPKNRPRNITTTSTPRTPEPAALAEVIKLPVSQLGPQHIGCRLEVMDRYDGMVGPAAGTLVGYRPAETPHGYNPGGAPWRTLLLAQGPGKGEMATVREVDNVKIAP
ncbi:hypothetical protein ACLBWP_03470 [Microbacterium sp. M1A1_1b]